MKKRSFVEIAMRYRAIVFLICAILVVFGAYGLENVRKNEFPNFTVRQGVVIAAYPGANVDEVKNRVTKPLEDFVFTYAEVDKKKTTSTTRDGLAIVQVTLDDDVSDKDAFWSKFKHGVQVLKNSLPAGVVAVLVMDDFGDASAILLTLESENKTYREMSEYLDCLTDRLRTLESVGRVNRFGEQKEQISIYLDNEKLSQYGLGYKSTMMMLAGQGLINVSGSLKDGAFNRPIYVKSGIENIRDIQETIVFSSPDGGVVRLKDVADVVREYPKPDSYIQQNGHKCVVLSIEMRSGYNIVKMGEEIESVLHDFENELPEEVKMSRVTDQTEVVAVSIRDFLKELLMAIISVVVVVMLLQPFRVALVAAGTIPVSIFIALGIFYGFSIELNTVTLAVLILTLGMIVDNSIVILDDYQEKIAEGVPRWRAAANSASHFFKSIFSATLAISITFFPFLVFMKGMFNDFLQSFPWAMTIVLMVSLGVAVLVVPYLQFTFLKPRERKQHKFNFESVSNAVYKKILKVCFKFPKAIILLAVVCVVVGAVAILERPIRLLPIAQRNQFSVEIFLPTGTSIERTSAVADSMERILENDTRIVSITSFKGMSSPRFHLTYAPQFGGTNFAQFIVNTKDVKATDEIIEEYAQKYAEHFTDAFVRFKQLSYSDAMSPIEYRLTGESEVEIKRAADKVADYLRSVPDFYMVRTSLKEPLNGVEVKLNEDASKMGVNQMVAQSLLAARYSGGLPVASLWEGDRNIPVVLKGSNADIADIATLANEKMATFGGLGNVPLRQIADLEPAFHDGERTRRNGFQVVTVSAELAYGKSANSAAKDHLQKVREIAKAENVDVEIGGEGEIVDVQMPRIITSLAAALIIIFFILLWHFRKISTAVLLFGSLSLCAFGTGVAMSIANLDFSVTCVLGIVSLLGIMVRNGIIMIDYAEELKREEHCDAQTAIFNSALRRMRPIFLTSAAASVGVIPMIMGGSSLWMPMGVVICFGTLITMCLILMVLPVLYWKVSGVRFRMRKSV